MARSEEENRAITEKIAYLVNIEGLRPDRATAAAFRMFKEGELDIPSKEPEIPQQNQIENEFKRERRSRIRIQRAKERKLKAEFATMLRNLLK